MKKVLVDTNILIYSVDPESVFHTSGKSMLEKALNKSIDAHIADKSLFEFYRVLTSKAYNKRIISSDVVDFYSFFMEHSKFTLLFSSYEILRISSELFIQYEGKGVAIFDLVLLSYALANNIDTIYTKNVKDFPQDLGVEIVDPT